MDYTHAILGSKKRALQALLPLEGKLRASAIMRNDYAGFRTAIDVGEYNLAVVTELSPSFPQIDYNDPAFNPTKLAKMYQQGGAHALSVVIEPDFFGGTMAHLAQVSRMATVPVLARGYFTHRVEITQAIVSGADAVNLIVGILDDPTLKELYDLALGLGIDAMLEVHSLEDMIRAMDLEPEPELVCINNESFASLRSNLTVTEQLIEELPASTIVLSAGGINSPDDALRMLEAGAHAILVNTSLADVNIPQDIIQELITLELP